MKWVPPGTTMGSLIKLIGIKRSLSPWICTSFFTGEVGPFQWITASIITRRSRALNVESIS